MGIQSRFFKSALSKDWHRIAFIFFTKAIKKKCLTFAVLAS